MTDNEKDKLRGLQRDTFPCEEAIIVLQPDFCAVLDPKRVRTRIDPCDPSIVCVPGVLQPPKAKPVRITPVYLVPNLLVVGNDSVTATCPTGKVGDSVTITTGTITRGIDWRNVPNIRVTQLDQIARASNISVVLELDVTVIRTVTKLDPLQIAYLIQVINDTKASLNTEAYAAAVQSLNCWYENTEQTATCSVSALHTSPTGSPSDMVFTATIPAGTYKSYVSLSEANNQAYTAAVALLVCCYGNDEKHVYCETGLGDANLGFTSTVKGTTSVTVAANTIFSCVSKEAANAEALAQGLASLECRYENVTVDITCSDYADYTRSTATVGHSETTGYASNQVSIYAVLDKKGVDTVDPAPTRHNPPVMSDYTGLSDGDFEQQGSRVIIRPGKCISQLSQEAADTEAEVWAASLLVCEWKNEEVTYTCAEAKVSEGVTKPADASRSIRSITAQYGLFSSLYDKDMVLQQLASFLEAALKCVYCNSVVVPKCLFDPALPKAALDQTVGTPVDTICAESFEDAQSTAQNLGDIPVRAVLGYCTYGNSEVTKHCWQKLGKASAEDLLGLNMDQSVESYTVPANSFVIEGDNPVDAQATVDALAEDAALAGLNCVFTNPEGIYRCGNGVNNNDFSTYFTSYTGTAPYWTRGGNVTGSMAEIGDLANGASIVSPTAIGSAAHPIRIPAGMFTSLLGYEDINNQISVYVTSSLNCFYTNVPIALFCGITPDNIHSWFATPEVWVTVHPGVSVPTGYIPVGDGRLPSDGTTPAFISAAGGLSDPVKIKAGVGFSNDSVNYANIDAILQNLASLDCYVINAAADLTCEDLDPPKSNDGLLDEASGTLHVPAGTFKSYTGYDEVNDQMDILKKTALMCLYGNTEQCADACADPMVMLNDPNPPCVAPKQIISAINQADADAMAKDLANAMRICVDLTTLKGDPGIDGTNGTNGIDGVDGAAGGQSECAGECYGYYS